MTRVRGGRATRRTVTGGALLAAVLALVVSGLGAGCAGSDDEDSASDAAGEESGGGGDGGGLDFEPDARRDEAEGAAPEEAAAGGEFAVDTVALAQAREVIRTGDLRLQVEDVGDAMADVRRIAGAAGGFVAQEEAVADDRRSTVTVRVPTDTFDDVRTDIADLGDVEEETVQAEDVTAEMVDVETRIESLRRSVTRLQEMLGGSGDVAQLATVEGELARREVELEAMLGQQRLIEDQVALATLSVSMFEDDAAPEPDEDAAGFRDGLRQGWVTFVDVGRALLAVLGFVLPWAIPAAAIGIPVRWWLLRRRSPTTTPPPPPAPTPAA